MSSLPSPSASKSAKIFFMSHFWWRAIDFSQRALSKNQPRSILASILSRSAFGMVESSSSIVTNPSPLTSKDLLRAQAGHDGTSERDGVRGWRRRFGRGHAYHTAQARWRRCMRCERAADSGVGRDGLGLSCSPALKDGWLLLELGSGAAVVRSRVRERARRRQGTHNMALSISDFSPERFVSPMARKARAIS